MFSPTACRGVSNAEVLTRRHRSGLRLDFRGGFQSQSATQCSRQPAGLGGWVPGSGGQRRGPGCSRMGWQHDGSPPGMGCGTWETIKEVQTVHNVDRWWSEREPSKSVHLRISDRGREKGARGTSLLDLSDLTGHKTGRTTKYWVAVYLFVRHEKPKRERKQAHHISILAISSNSSKLISTAISLTSPLFSFNIKDTIIKDTTQTMYTRRKLDPNHSTSWIHL